MLGPALTTTIRKAHGRAGAVVPLGWPLPTLLTCRSATAFDRWWIAVPVLLRRRVVRQWSSLTVLVAVTLLTGTVKGGGQLLIGARAPASVWSCCRSRSCGPRRPCPPTTLPVTLPAAVPLLLY